LLLVALLLLPKEWDKFSLDYYWRDNYVAKNKPLPINCHSINLVALWPRPERNTAGMWPLK